MIVKKSAVKLKGAPEALLGNYRELHYDLSHRNA